MTTMTAPGKTMRPKIDPANLRVCGWRLLIESTAMNDEANTSAGGIVLPASVQEDKATTVARVVAIGSGRVTEHGVTIPIKGYNVGDFVVVGKYSGTPIGRDNSAYRIINEPEVLAVINGQ